MIIDSSVFVAILANEPDAERLSRAIQDASKPSVSAATLVEVGMVLPERQADLAVVIRESRIAIVPFDEAQVAIAWDARRRFGRGTGSKARLNFGDCFSYALAKHLGQPLLYKGDDFRHTDVEAAR